MTSQSQFSNEDTTRTGRITGLGTTEGPFESGINTMSTKTNQGSMHQGQPYDMGGDQHGAGPEGNTVSSAFEAGGDEPRQGIERYDDKSTILPEADLKRDEDRLEVHPNQAGGQYDSSKQDSRRHEDRPEPPRRGEEPSRVPQVEGGIPQTESRQVPQTEPTHEKSLPRLPLHQGNTTGEPDLVTGQGCPKCGDMNRECDCFSVCECGAGESCEKCDGRSSNTKLESNSEQGETTTAHKQGPMTALTGKAQHALGVLLRDDEMKQRGLEKQPGKIAEMQNRELAEAEGRA
ncbi:hypothetical protein C8J56DRAFT_369974 [Mycena floridula]|nr:hypothetical protein C8J56DRAFT_369974 [Mycena floridula]